MNKAELAKLIEELKGAGKAEYYTNLPNEDIIREIADILNDRFPNGIDIWFCQSADKDYMNLLFAYRRYRVLCCEEHHYVDVLGLVPAESEMLKNLLNKKFNIRGENE